MNFLAHLYLSGNNDGFKVGNFIADFVKGNRYMTYETDVRTGIVMHRDIDSFTDQHDHTRSAKSLLKPAYGRYAGIVVDMFFDHFLAASWHKHHTSPLPDFQHHCFDVLKAHWHVLPAPVQHFVPFMIQADRLVSYSRSEGIAQSLDIMSRNSSLPDCSELAMQVMHEHYQTFDTLFQDFFSQIKTFVQNKYDVKF